MSTNTSSQRMLEQTSTDMQIFVKPCFVNNVGTFGLNIEVPNVIGNVILMIEAMTGIPAQHLRVERGGRPLLDTDHFSDYDIKEGDTLECLLRNHSGDCECCAE